MHWAATLADMNAAVQQLEELFGGNPDLDISVEDLYTRIEESGILEGQLACPSFAHNGDPVCEYSGRPSISSLTSIQGCCEVPKLELVGWYASFQVDPRKQGFVLNCW